jgi:acylphosphatase
MALARLEVSGAVQGVGFRWFAREAGQRLGLAGWVRNRADGAVEIAVEGDDAAVEQFLRQVQRGPSGAVVEQVRHLPTGGLEPLTRPFAILR